MPKYNYTTMRNDYMTPPEVLEMAWDWAFNFLHRNRATSSHRFYKGEVCFDLDVCCSIKNIPAKLHYVHGAYDGLKEDWKPLNWMNPPFSTCEKWVRKAVTEQLKGKTTVAILPVRTESLFWHECILNNKNTSVKFLIKNKKDGVTFIDPETGDYVRNEKGEKGLFKNPLALVIFKGVSYAKAR